MEKCMLDFYSFISDDVPHVCGGYQDSGHSNQCWKLHVTTEQWSHAGRYVCYILRSLLYYSRVFCLKHVPVSRSL